MHLVGPVAEDLEENLEDGVAGAVADGLQEMTVETEVETGTWTFVTVIAMTEAVSVIARGTGASPEIFDHVVLLLVAQDRLIETSETETAMDLLA
ncbi:hypothetical protein SNK03_000406 [Fusarium graminearum]|jgi:hypothetical protein